MASFTPISLGLMIHQISSTGFWVWMQRRRENGPLNGLWEFPGGKWEAGESPYQACCREVQEETGACVHSWLLFKIYPFRDLVLHAYLSIERKEGSLTPFNLPKSATQMWFFIPFEHPLQDFEGKGGESLIPEINKTILRDLALYVREREQDQDGEILCRSLLF